MGLKTILVVDDEPDVLRTVCRILDREDRYNLLQASDPDEAVRVVADFGGPIHLAILDISLPGRSGFELASELQISHPKILFLFISGEAGSELLRYVGIAVTDSQFLAKPFRATELTRRVSQLLSEAKETEAGHAVSSGSV